jgi:hypothetical protein
MEVIMPSYRLVVIKNKLRIREAPKTEMTQEEKSMKTFVFCFVLFFVVIKLEDI